MYLAIVIVATAISGTLVNSRLRFSFPKRFLVSLFEWFGDLGLFCARLFRSALAPPYEFRELIRQCDEIGSKSLPLIALAGAATGVVMSLQTRDSLVRFGAKSFLPAVIVFSLVKESGPMAISGATVLAQRYSRSASRAPFPVCMPAAASAADLAPEGETARMTGNMAVNLQFVFLSILQLKLAEAAVIALAPRR